MKREIYSFTSTIELEKYVNDLRIAHAKNYLATKIDLRQLTDADVLAVYALLETRDKNKIQKMLDEIKPDISKERE